MKTRIDINLLPPEFKPAPAVGWLPPFLALIYSLTAFLIIWLVISHFVKVGALRSDIKSLEQSVKSLEPFETVYDQVKVAASDMESLKKVFNALDAHYLDWPIFLVKLDALVPESVWLTSVKGLVIETEQVEVVQEPKQDEKKPAPATGARKKVTKKKEKVMVVHRGDLTIEGKTSAQNLEPVSLFLDRLRKDEYFVDPVLETADLEEQTDENLPTRYVFRIRTSVSIPEPAEDGKEKSDKANPNGKEWASAGSENKSNEASTSGENE